MEQKVFFQNSEGRKLCAILNKMGLDRPIIILVHGHSSNKNTKNYVLLSEILAKRNISTIRLDLSGHGESEGKFEETTVSDAVNDIIDTINFLKKEGYQKIGLIGSSFGGLASIIAASKSKDLILLGLKSPVSTYEDKYLESKGEEFIKQWEENDNRDYLMNDGTVLKLKYSFYEDALKNNAYKVANKITIPTLIVHGDNDNEVPLSQSIKLSKIIPNSKLIIVKGSDHTYSKPEHSKQLLQSLSDFIFVLL